MKKEGRWGSRLGGEVEPGVICLTIKLMCLWKI